MHVRGWMVLSFLACVGGVLLTSRAAPHAVDLSAVVNVAGEDDGVAGNGQGGWTDEGINDMFLFPPLPVGAAERNGYQFTLLDPAAPGGRVALMLRVHADDHRRPAAQRVEVPDVKAAYVYFVHHAIGGSATKAGETNGLYTIHYADGQDVIAPMEKGRHLRDWWCRDWWDNSGADAWPVHMGRNLYTMKWNSLIGLWATQWANPRPTVPIRGITFASCDRGGPVIWAVTLDDADYRADEAGNKGNAWGRIALAPDGYFARKLEAEREAIFTAAVAAGHVEGVRAVALIRADLLAITVDPALTRMASGPGEAVAAAAQRPDRFTISSDDDAAFAGGVRPTAVGRDSFEYWNGNIGPFQQNAIYWHTYYLQLPRPLQSGHGYRVQVAGLDASVRDAMELKYDEAQTETVALKVNQVAYSSRATRRYAYLGWWAGDLGAVDYTACARFEVVEEPGGKVVLTGATTGRSDTPGGSGEAVRELDLSALPAGRFHVRVPGLGRSASFSVGGEQMRELYTHTQRAFYHQRCGFPLALPYTRFIKPACHLWVDEAGHMQQDGTRPGVREFRGGYHDAADFDCFTYHLRATAQNLDAYAMAPARFPDGDLNLPESGNGIPDLLDEAEWGLRFWREHQRPDGGVPKGRCNDQDSRRQNAVVWGPFGIFQPDADSNYEYAAVAATFARLYRAHDATLADRYLASAVKAFDWALAQPVTGDAAHNGFVLWAAGALFRATGEARFNELFMARYASGGLRTHWKLASLGGLMRWAYVLCEQPGTDAALRVRLRAEILQSADYQLDRRLEAEAYRWGGDSTRGMGWGNGNGGGHYAESLLRAWWLTGEQKYLDGASLNADFQLGCNPLSKTFITGMGARPPLHPQISAFLYERPDKRGGTVQGITVYGLTDNMPSSWYPAKRPALRRWRDLGNGGAEISSEFTITETIGASALLYAVLYAADLGLQPPSAGVSP